MICTVRNKQVFRGIRQTSCLLKQLQNGKNSWISHMLKLAGYHLGGLCKDETVEEDPHWTT